jgi:hypothetical protein
MTAPESPTPDPGRRVTVTRAARQGWVVSEERGDRVVRRVTYTDWHRVERALGLHRAGRAADEADGEPVTD